jgi:hypothetical protein
LLFQEFDCVEIGIAFLFFGLKVFLVNIRHFLNVASIILLDDVYEIVELHNFGLLSFYFIQMLVLDLQLKKIRLNWLVLVKINFRGWLELANDFRLWKLLLLKISFPLC